MPNRNGKHLKLIYDNYHGNIEFSFLESLLLQSPLMNRLHQVLQNSTAYLVYPCCKTSRFEHSIGVMDYASKLFKNALSNSIVSNDFLEDKSKVIAEIFTDKIKNLHIGTGGLGEGKGPFLKEIKTKYEIDLNNIENTLDSKIFRNYVINFIGEEFVKRNIWFTFSNVHFKEASYQNSNDFTIRQEVTLLFLHQALRLSALFHDIGHLPFSHLFEVAIENIWHYLKSKKKPNKTEIEALEAILTILNYRGKIEEKEITIDTKGKNNSLGQIHEQIGKKISEFIFKDLREKLFESGTEDYRIKIIIIDFIEGVLNQLRQGYPDSKNNLYSLYEIVDGIIDADRLDFVQRDGANSGISISVGDIDRLIKLYNLTKIPIQKYKNGYDKYCFLPAIQSIHEVEEVLNDRYKVYKYLVNHHAVKRTDHILQHLIEQRIKNDINEIENNRINNSSIDKEPDNLDFNINYIYDAIKISNSVFIAEKEQEFRKVIYSFFQLTDFWLLSILNRDFNQHLIKYHTSSSEKKDIEKHRYYYLLSQIYENSRYYKSLWKRDYDFETFICELGKTFYKKFNTIKKKILKFDDAEVGKETYENIKSIINCIERIEKKCINQQNNLNDQICNLKCSCSANLQYKICKKDMCLDKHNVKLGRLIIHMLKIIHNKGEWCRTLEEITNERNDFWILVAQPKLKSGFKTKFDHIEGDSFLVIDNKSKKIEEFDQVSVLRKSIESDIDKTISFFVYYHILNSKKDEKDLEEQIVIKISEIFERELTTAREKQKHIENTIISS